MAQLFGRKRGPDKHVKGKIIMKKKYFFIVISFVVNVSDVARAVLARPN